MKHTPRIQHPPREPVRHRGLRVIAARSRGSVGGLHGSCSIPDEPLRERTSDGSAFGNVTRGAGSRPRGGLVLYLRRFPPLQCVESGSHGLELLGRMTDPVDELANNEQRLAAS